MNILNRIANQIAKHAKKFGMEIDFRPIEDIEHSIKAAHVDIQAGLKGTFPDSQVIQVTVYDDDNIKVALPDKLARTFGLENFNAFVNVKRTKDFLRGIYRKL